MSGLNGTLSGITLVPGGGGVSSLNAVSGDVTLTSTGGSVTITPAVSTINIEAAAGAITLARTGASTYSTVQNLMNFSLSSGSSSGGNITASATANAVDVAAGTGFIRATDSNVATQTFFDWAASSALSVPSGSTRYIGVEYNAGTPQVVARTTDVWDLDTEFPLGVVCNEGGTRYISNIPWVGADNNSNIIERFDSITPVARDNRIGGLILSNTGTRNVAVTAGALLSRMSEFTISAIDTSAASTFDAYYRNGSGGFTKQSAQTQVENTKYDNGTGTLANISVLSYASRWFYLMTDGSLAMQYGRADYTSFATALNDPVPSSAPDRIAKEGMLIGRFIYLVSGTSPASTQTAFGTAFTSGGVTSASDLSNGVTGSGAIVLASNATLVAPALGTPASGVATNLTGTASGLTAGAVSNATLTAALTVNTGTVTLTGNVANTSALTIGAGAVSVSGSNTGDQTSVSGNAGTATALQNTRTIWGQNFNGSANVTGDITLGTGNITMTGSIGATGARVTKVWAADMQVTNAIAGSITGNAATVSNATLTTALTVNTGTLTLTANAANTSVLTVGAGAVSVSGSNTGDQTTVSGNAGTATALQNARTIGGVSFDGTANITVSTATGGFTVSGGNLTTPNIVGSDGTADAAAGCVGQVITATGTGVNVVSGTDVTVATVALPAGDWDLYGAVTLNPGATTSITRQYGSISTTTNSVNFAEATSTNQAAYVPGAITLRYTVPMVRVLVPASANYFLTHSVIFTASAMSSGGKIVARRRR